MNLLGRLGEGTFVLSTGAGQGRVFTLDGGELVLGNVHRLDPETVSALQPSPSDRERIVALAELVLREGTAEGTGFPGETVIVLPRSEAERLAGMRVR